MNWFTTTAVSAILSVLMYASGFLVIFTPLPLMYACVARGRSSFLLSASMGAMLVVALELMLKSGGGDMVAKIVTLPTVAVGGSLTETATLVAGVVHYFYFALIAFVLGLGAMRKWDLMRVCGFAVVAGMLVLATAVASAVSGGVQEALGSLRTILGQTLEEIVELNRQANVNSAYLNLLVEKKDAIVSFLIGILPSLAFSATLFVVALNFIVCRRILRKNHPFSHVHNAARFRLPDWFVWVGIASGFLFFINQYTIKDGAALVAAANGMIIALSAYFFQGMAVVAYLLQQIKAPFTRTILYLIIIMFFQTISVMIVALGVADVWADFRLRSYKAKHRHGTE